ncbi:MAG: radical SAM protein [Candidatus Omnitrophica bacterium]|nr:radical SAM protein [Candidatus Omnitrophota bacterium]MBD3269106.1 radical SAM protein [Candidatus Omnitrophota bacterium]
MKKVALINPPQKYYKKSLPFSLYIPIGLLSIASKIRNICKLDFFDFLAEDFTRINFGGYYIYGSQPETIKRRIAESRPDIIGISIPFSTQLEEALKIKDICKEANPAARIIFGGPEPSIRYRSLLRDKACDFCIVGEGEEAFYELVECFKEGREARDIKGVAYIKREELIYTEREYIEDLDSLPFPAYELINFRNYWENPYFYNIRSSLKKLSVPVFTSRGCPYECIFCSVHLHMGHRYRVNSEDYVIRHLRYCMEEFGVKRFHFEDDNISLDRRRFENILDKIISSGLEIEWDAPNGIRADTLDYDLLKKMKNSGCRSLSIGIESGNQEVLNKIIKKNTSLEKIIGVARGCKKLGMRLLAFYVIGFPGETKENIKDTVDFALKLLKDYDVNPALLFATPLYGTELYNICRRDDLLPEKMDEYSLAVATQPYGVPIIETDEFSRNYLKRIVRNYNLRLLPGLITYHLRRKKRRIKNFILKTYEF